MLVLIIACANVASVLLMRAVRRGREDGCARFRSAPRGGIVRQLLVESLVLASMGGALGFVLAFVGLELIARDNSLPSWMSLTMDAHVFAVLAGVCLGTVFLFGLVPSLHVSSVDGHAGLKDGARDTGGRRAALDSRLPGNRVSQ